MLVMAPNRKYFMPDSVDLSSSRLNPGLAAGLEESLQPFVPESTNHKCKCNLWRYELQGAQRTPITRAGKRTLACVVCMGRCVWGRCVWGRSANYWWRIKENGLRPPQRGVQPPPEAVGCNTGLDLLQDEAKYCCKFTRPSSPSSNLALRSVRSCRLLGLLECARREYRS